MLFEEQLSRKPDLYPWSRDFIDAMWQGHWTPNEFNFQSDLHDYKVNLSKDEQTIIKNTLSAIAQIEVAVKKFWARLGDNLPHPSMSDLGLTMANIEVVHNCAYEKLLTVLGLEDVFEENLKLDIIKGRVNYLQKYNHKYYKDSKKQYVYSIILFTLFVENISLFSQFYVINWFNRYKNVLKDSAHQVSYTNREEALHFLAGAKIINVMREEYPELFDEDLKNKVLLEAQETFNCESKIIDWIIGDYSENNMNADILKAFTKDRINASLLQVGYPIIFNDIDQELLDKSDWFNEDVTGNVSTDFFHIRPTNYVKDSKTYNEEDLF